MPQLVTRTVPASRLSNGDKVLQVDNLKGHVLCGKVVEDITVKTKLAHILPAKGVKVTLPLDSEVVVERAERTAEERAAAEQVYAMAYIQRQIDASPRHVEESKADLVKDLDFAPN